MGIFNWLFGSKNMRVVILAVLLFATLSYSVRIREKIAVKCPRKLAKTVFLQGYPTCSRYWLESSHILKAHCGSQIPSFDLNAKIGNNDGVLTQGHKYIESCESCRFDSVAFTLSCSCKNHDGDLKKTSINVSSYKPTPAYESEPTSELIPSSAPINEDDDDDECWVLEALKVTKLTLLKLCHQPCHNWERIRILKTWKICNKYF